MRVLLIEDDSATAQSIELMLKSENFNVYTTDLDGYLASSHVLSQRFAAWDNLPAGGILTQVARLAMPPLMVELVATATR